MSPLAAALVAAIHLYRWVARRVPRSRACLFEVSCSRHAERIARTEGFRSAARATWARLAACRPGYSFEYAGSEWQVRCVDGSVIDGRDASPAIHEEAAICRGVIPAR